MLAAPPRSTLPGVFALLAITALVAGCGEDASGNARRTNPAFRDAVKERTKELDPREVGVGRRVPDLAFLDLEGRAGKLSDYSDSTALVVMVRDVGCPVCKRNGNRIAEIEDEYAARGVDFLFVNMASHDDAEEMNAEIERYGFEGRYVHDPDELFGKTLGAETTTDAFLLDPSRTLRYRGAVDDQFGRGYTLPDAQREFLRDALDAVLAGEEVALKATTAPGCFLGIEVAEILPASDAPTYHGEVSRILLDNCVRCHRQGGAAPFSLETYEDARGRKGMVKYVVREKVMPPWYAADGTGPWENDLRLKEADRETLLAWIAAGCDEGDPADAVRPVAWQEGWLIGEPDLIFRLPQPFEVPAEGVVPYTPFVAEEVVPEDVWVERLQLLPTDPEVVHHATVTFQPPNTKGPQTLLMDTLVPWMRRGYYGGWQFLFGFLPGKGPRVYEEGTARFLPKGSRIRFEMHYTPKGEPTLDQTALGLVLSKEEPAYVAQTRMIRNFEIFVPPGEPNMEWSQEYVLPANVLLRSVTPHMHLRGRTFHADLILPDGSEERLIEIPEWDPDWQFSYVFRDELRVPRGARIRITGWFDNSVDNPNNPDPTQYVNDGQQIWDEMLMMAAEWTRPRAEQ